jgi:hypothetical protein
MIHRADTKIRKGGTAFSTSTKREREGPGPRICAYTVEQILVGQHSLQARKIRRGGTALSTGPTKEREGSGARTCGYTVEQIPVGKYSLRARKIRRCGTGLSTSVRRSWAAGLRPMGRAGRLSRPGLRYRPVWLAPKPIVV